MVRKKSVFFAFALLLLFVGWLPKLGAEQVAWHKDNDFAHFYLTAEISRQGTSPYGRDLAPLYDAKGFSPTRTISTPAIPPPLIMVLTPITFLPPLSGFVAWTLIQLCSLGVGSFILIRMFGLGLFPGRALLLVVSAFAPLGVYAHIRYGQTQALMFLLVVLGLALMQRDKRPYPAFGVFLWGVAASLKLFTLPLLFVAWRYRGLRGIVFFLLGFVALWIPFALLCGVEAVGAFFSAGIPYIRDLAYEFSGNISLSGAIVYTQRILSGYDYFSPAAIQLLCVSLFVPLLWLEFRSARDLPLSTMTILVASVLLSPTAWPHYLPLVTGAFFVLLYQRAKRGLLADSRSLFLLYVCFCASTGVLSKADIFTRLVSAWWGPGCLMILLILLFKMRQGMSVPSTGGR